MKFRLCLRQNWYRTLKVFFVPYVEIDIIKVFKPVIDDDLLEVGTKLRNTSIVGVPIV